MSKSILAALTAACAVLALAIAPAANAKKGPPTAESSKNLSVPAIFVGTTNAPFTCSATSATNPSGTTLTFPSDFALPLLTQEDGTSTPSGEYYLQGQASWQAECANASDDTLGVVGDWGDNLSGDAALKVNAPVRVEMGLLVDGDAATEGIQAIDPATDAAMLGFKVLKLTDELDRYATYGTSMTTAADLGEIRAYDDGATWTIKGPVTVLDGASASAEVNSTGRVVYGYNWTPRVAGTYTLTFYAPSVTMLNGSDDHTISIEVTIAPAVGKGKKGGR
jgi:hypothetical protein